MNDKQDPVIAFDLALFTIAKPVEWKWKEFHDETNFVVRMSALHIEVIGFKCLQSAQFFPILPFNTP